MSCGLVTSVANALQACRLTWAFSEQNVRRSARHGARRGGSARIERDGAPIGGKSGHVAARGPNPVELTGEVGERLVPGGRIERLDELLRDADQHRHVAADLARREKLIGCLDIFVEAGWPKARRLLYRLPELL